MTATTTQEATTTTARKQELFDHLLYYLYHDCHVYACAHKGDAFYEHLEEGLGEIKGSDLEALSVIAETLAEYVMYDISYSEVMQ